MEKSDTLNSILALSCILLSKKKQLPRNYYKTTSYNSLISSTKQVSDCVGVGGVGGCTGCFTKKYNQIKF